MSKFKVRLKVTGLELEVEGSREDVPLITQSVGQQLSGLLQPGAMIVDGEFVSNGPANRGAATEPVTVSAKKRPSKPRAAASTGGRSSTEDILNWVHDPTKWGTPQQQWVTSKKAVWLLYVGGHESGTTSMSTRLIANTFNKHFQQAKTIQVSKVSRDLGRLKVGKDAQVGEDTTQNPSAWFLTNTGQAEAKKLVDEALGQSKAE
jgi:hypothetical protein